LLFHALIYWFLRKYKKSLRKTTKKYSNYFIVFRKQPDVWRARLLALMLMLLPMVAASCNGDDQAFLFLRIASSHNKRTQTAFKEKMKLFITVILSAMDAYMKMQMTTIISI
jgi:hypothetical protein